jgi:ribosomal subunit interface protein
MRERGTRTRVSTVFRRGQSFLASGLGGARAMPRFTIMNIEVRTSNIPISEALQLHIRRKIDLALRRFEDRVEHVLVRLVDVNGPKGGSDKQCRIVARLPRSLPSVVVTATDGDPYVAVSRAVSRLQGRVARTHQRWWSPAASG